MKRITYKVRTIAAITPERVFYKYVTATKKDLTTHCQDCGTALVEKFDGSYAYYDGKKRKRTNSYVFVCPDKKWYNLFSHYNSKQIKLVTETTK